MLLNIVTNVVVVTDADLVGIVFFVYVVVDVIVYVVVDVIVYVVGVYVVIVVCCCYH